MANQQKVVLIILDGFGYSAVEQGNAIIQAKTPFFDFALKHYLHASLQASGDGVGLPWGEMGNSEVGHINLGAGRVVLQDYPQITKTIQNGSFFTRPAFARTLEHLEKNHGRLHLLGIASSGAVHGHIDHLLALIDWAAQAQFQDVAIHIITDGRDCPPKSAATFIGQLEHKLKEKPIGRIASISGRYFAMDRDKRWERIEKVYNLLAEGKGAVAPDANKAIKEAYKKGQTDEFIEPIVIGHAATLRDGDALIFTNYRPDRAIQLTKSLADPKFNAFKIRPLRNVKIVTMTNYEDTNLPVDVAFSSIDLTNPTSNSLNHPLAEVVASQGLPQLHIAETEKYAHVTYFFDNGRTKPFNQENQVLVPSPKVATYDLKPEMSAAIIVDQFTKHFSAKNPALTVINFANADMVGHTGNFKQTLKAITVLDQSVAAISSYALNTGAHLIITADHGNAEQMINLETGQIDKEHTISPVPFILAKPGDATPTDQVPLSAKEKRTIFSQEPVGLLADVAPTILEILELPKPYEMTGASLINLL